MPQSSAVVAVFVLSKRHPNCVLIGIRKNAFGEGTYALPGGFVEFGERIEECGRREVLEETDLRLENVHIDGLLNAVWTSEERHYFTILMRADVDENYRLEPTTVEPHKCQGWEWHDWNNLPNKLFAPLQRIKDSGYCPFRENNSQFTCIEFKS